MSSAPNEVTTVPKRKLPAPNVTVDRVPADVP